QVQYANFDDVSDISLNSPGTWRDFPNGTTNNGPGGEQFLRVSGTPVSARWVRVVMTASSNRAPKGSTDIRDQLGYAIHEIYLGSVDASGRLVDEVRHAADPKLQTVIHVSSTDPWHRFVDVDQRVEQLGFDRVFQTGLTNRMPMLAPVAV